MGKLADWLFGVEVMSRVEVEKLIEAKERTHVWVFDQQIQRMKAKISEFDNLRHRVNQLEATLPKRDEKGHFVKKESVPSLPKELIFND